MRHFPTWIAALLFAPALAWAQISPAPVYPGGSSGQVQLNNGANGFSGVTIGGDATLNPGTGALTIGSTGGVSFAPSATTDATNAANIGSGILPSARLSGTYSGITGVGTLSAGAVPVGLVTGLPAYLASPPAIGGTAPAAITGTTVTGGAIVANEAISGSLSSGALSYGTLGFSDTGLAQSLQASINGYVQAVVQNSSSGAAASADVIVANNNATASTYYGDFGINSSGFTGTGSLSLPNATYLYAASGDLAIGTLTANGIHFVVNGGATDALAISSGGLVSLPGLTASVNVCTDASKNFTTSCANEVAIGNLATIAADNLLGNASASTASVAAVPLLNCSGASNALLYSTSTHAFSCNTISGSGTVTTTGSPASGNLAKFSGATSVTNGDLSGDCATSGTLTVTCTKTNSVAFGSAATVNTGTSGATIPLLNGANTHSGAATFSAAGAASTPGLLVSGAHFSGGTGSTTEPQALVQDSTATASSAWSTSGTAIGIDAHTGIGNLIDAQVDGSSKFSLSASGSATFAGGITSNSNVSMNATNVNFSGGIVFSKSIPATTTGFASGNVAGVGSSNAFFTVTLASGFSSTAWTVTFGAAATHGYACVGQDETTSGVGIRQSAHTTTVTSFAVTGTPASGDLIVFNCGGF